MSRKTAPLAVDVALYEDQTDCVFRELELAFQWQRPSILFAIYDSTSVRRVAQEALETRILEAGKNVIHYQNNEPENANLIQFVSRITDHDQTIFFIDPLKNNVQKAQVENLYKVLNSSRDHLIDRLVRVVFWLTESEASTLAHIAPDFWASRHRVVDFVTPSSQEATVKPDAALASTTPIQEKALPENKATMLLTMGVKYWKQGDHTSSVKYLRAALSIAEKKADKARQAVCLKALALVQSDAGMVDAAIEAYNKHIELSPDDITSWNNLGALYMKTGQTGQALQTYNTSVKKSPDDPVSWNGLGNVYKSTGRNKDAILCYRRAIQSNNHFLPAWINMGDIYAAMNLNEIALQIFTRAASIDENKPQPWSGIGGIHFKNKAYPQAVKAYNRAIELGESGDEFSANLAESFSALGQHTQAIAWFQKAIEFCSLKSEKGRLWNRLSDSYRLAGEYENSTAAHKMADKLIPGQPKNPSADSPIPAQKPEKPELPTPAAAEKAPSTQALPLQNKASLWLQLGNLYIKVGDLDKAIDAYEKAANLDNRNGQTLARIAGLYEQKNDPSRALAFYQKSLDLQTSDSERAACLRVIAGLQRQMKEYNQALQSIESAITLDPAADANLSILASIQADLDGSVSTPTAHQPSSVSSAVQPPNHLANPADALLENGTIDNANVLNELGNIFAKSASYDEAIDYYRRAMQLDPDFGWAYSNLAQVFTLQGKHEQALGLYQKSIELLTSDTDKAITWNRLGDLYRQTNRYNDAMLAYQNADRLHSAKNKAGGNFREVDFDQPFTHFVL